MDAIIEELGYYKIGWERNIERLEKDIAFHEQGITHANEKITKLRDELHHNLDTIDQVDEAINILREASNAAS